MKIAFLTSGRDVPSSRFRVLQYVPYLRQLGHACVIYPSRPAKYRGLPLLGNRLSDAPRIASRALDGLRLAIARADIVVIERELLSSGYAGLERLIRRIAHTLVLDVDDAIFLQHPRKFEELARLADTLIAGNDLLRERIQPLNPNVVVLPTCVDLARYRRVFPAQRLPVPVVGWTGTAANYPYLASVLPALRTVAAEQRFSLRIIAERPPDTDLDLAGLTWRFVPWSRETEIADLSELDVGLMPLDDTEWTRYKCGLKILQYMALHIPSIASPVGVNAQIIEHGRNGFLASTSEEWANALRALLADSSLRERIARAGRETVEQRFSIEAHAPRLVEILESAVAISREKARVQ